MNKPSKTLTTGQYVTLAATFFLMCVLRLPITLFLLFAFALALTLITGRKSYCAHYCPMGTLQDHFFPAQSAGGSKPGSHGAGKDYGQAGAGGGPGRTGSGGRRGFPRWIRMLRWPLFLVFWGYLVYMTYASFPSGEALWESLLLLMLVSAVTAFLLQALVRKRSWCSQLCPFGRVLDGAIKLRRRTSLTPSIRKGA